MSADIITRLRDEANATEELDPTNSSIDAMRDAADVLATLRAGISDLERELLKMMRSTQ